LSEKLLCSCLGGGGIGDALQFAVGGLADVIQLLGAREVLGKLHLLVDLGPPCRLSGTWLVGVPSRILFS